MAKQLRSVVHSLGNFIIVVVAVAKHDDEDDEGEDDHKEEGHNYCNHSDTGFFGIRFVGFNVN